MRRLGEVPAFQAWVQPPRQVDQLGRAEALQSRRGVQVITLVGTAGFSELSSHRPMMPGLDGRGTVAVGVSLAGGLLDGRMQAREGPGLAGRQ